MLIALLLFPPRSISLLLVITSSNATESSRAVWVIGERGRESLTDPIRGVQYK